MWEYLQAIDDLLLIYINRNWCWPVLDVLCPILRQKETWIPLYLLIAGFTYWKFGKGVLVWIVAGALTVLFTDQAAHLFKLFYHRLRPCNDPNWTPYMLLRTGHCSATFSFISAHAANHFGQAYLYHRIVRYKLASVFFFAWAFAIAYSQVYVGVHFPSDVFAGALVGLLAGWIMSRLAEKMIRRYF